MHKLVLAVCATVALSAAFAAAQPAPGGGRHAFIAQADANHDGNITRAEWNSARAAQFTQADANHDNQLSGEERPHWGGHGGGGGQPPAGGPPAGGAPQGSPASDGEHHHMMNPDSNGDGNLSRAEYDAQGAAMFNRLDADANGTITAAELQAAHDRMHDRTHGR